MLEAWGGLPAGAPAKLVVCVKALLMIAEKRSLAAGKSWGKGKNVVHAPSARRHVPPGVLVVLERLLKKESTSERVVAMRWNGDAASAPSAGTAAPPNIIDQ